MNSNCDAYETCEKCPDRIGYTEYTKPSPTPSQIPHVPSEQEIEEEILRIEDDINELSQYERNLRQAARAIEAYVNDWQKQLRRMHKEIEVLEKKRLELEKSSILQKKADKAAEKTMDSLMSKFAKLSPEQQRKMIAKLAGGK
jgi:predicted nuclease with TOPRIM domain